MLCVPRGSTRSRTISDEHQQHVARPHDLSLHRALVTIRGSARGGTAWRKPGNKDVLMMEDIPSALHSPMPKRHAHDEVRYLLLLAEGCRLAARRAPQSVGAEALIAKARRFEEFAELTLHRAPDHEMHRSVQPTGPSASQCHNNVFTFVRRTMSRVSRFWSAPHFDRTPGAT